MIYNIKDDELSIELIDRIDSDNCAEVEKNIFQVIEANKHETLVIDAASLKYISSAGLRILLKLSKTGKPFKIINVSNDVYDTFELTGFTSILDITKALRFVSVKDLEIIGKGSHGHVYRLDAETIVKVYHDGSSLEMIDTERNRCKNAFIQGISCPIAFDVVQTEEGLGVVLELAGAQTLSSFIMKNPDKLEEYAVKFAKLIKQFNSTTIPDNDLDSIADIYRKRIDMGKPYFTDDEYNICIRMLYAIQNRDTLIHGDYHPNNVMVGNDGELIIIDMADISKGNPLFDIGGCYTSMIQSGLDNPETTLKVIGLDYEKSKKMYDICIRTYYDVKSEEQFELIKKRLAVFGAFRTFASLGTSSEMYNKYRDLILEKARVEFFPNAEGMIKLIGMEF